METLSTTSIDPANSVLDYSGEPSLNIFVVFWMSYSIGLIVIIGLVLNLNG